MRKLWACVILISCFFAGYGQEAMLQSFGLAEGLPSLNVFSLHLDADGFLWAGTPQGLVRYDGDQFELIPGYPAPGEFIMRVWTGPNDERWFQSSQGKTFIYNGDSTRAYPYNSLIEEYVSKGNNHSINTAHLDAAGTLHIGFNGLGYVQIDSSGNLTAQNLENHEPGYFVREIEGELFDFGINSNSNSHFRTPLMEIDKADFHLRYEYDFDERFKMVFLRSSYALKDGRILVVTGNHILEVFPNKKVKEHFMPRVIYHVMEAEDGRLIISYLLGGSEVFDAKLKPMPVRFSQLDGNRLGLFLPDRQGGYWVKGSNQGLYYLQSLDILRFGMGGKSKANQITGLCHDGEGGVYYAAADGKINFIPPGAQPEFIVQLPPDGSMGSFVQAMAFDSLTHSLLLSSNSHNLLWKGGKLTFLTGSGRMEPFFRIVDMGKGAYLGINPWYIGPFPFGTELDWPERRMENFSYLSGAVKAPDGVVWFASHDTLYRCTSTTIESISPPKELSNKVIYGALHLDDAGNLIVGGGEAGLAIVSEGKSQWIGETEGISGFVKGGTMLPNGDLWVTQRQGLVRVREKEPAGYEFKHLGREQGLSSLGIEGMIYDNHFFWITDQEGLIRIDPTKLQLEFPPAPLHIVKVETQDSVYTEVPAVLSPNENSLTFHFRSLNFHQAGNLRYQYRLEGLENDWVDAPSNQVRFPQLRSGSYVFSVRSATGQGTWGAPISQSFKVLPAFYETLWFVLICSFLALGVLFSIFLLVVARIRRANQMREQNLLFEQQALNAQMNPHFVFNSLNSIQAFIVQHDTRNSIRYLSKFAKLMRASLDASQVRTISIQAEMNLLTHYCALEKLRFNNGFEFEIEVAPELDREKVGLPTYLIQPHVENAIWHGLQHLPTESQGKLEIRFWAEGEALHCEVKDNGIGREASKLMKTGKAGRQSHAIQIMRKRLELFRKIHPKASFELTFLDLTDDQGNPAGTAVQLQLPKLSVKQPEKA